MRPVLFALAAAAMAAGAVHAQAPRPTPELIRLHDALHLNADQEAAWKAYTRAVTPSADARARHQAAQQMMPRLTTPRRVALMDSMMTADLADMKRAGMGVLAFYDKLTPAQKRTFDEETARPPEDDDREP